MHSLLSYFADFVSRSSSSIFGKVMNVLIPLNTLFSCVMWKTYPIKSNVPSITDKLTETNGFVDNFVG